MGWKRLEEYRKKGKVDRGVSVSQVYGMWVRRAIAGRDLGKHQNSTEKNPLASDIHTRTLRLFGHLDCECDLLPDNLPP